MTWHKNAATGDIHRLHDQEYADTTVRDADTTWNGDSTNIGKVIKVTAGPIFFLLEDNVPTWLEITTSVSQSLAGSLAVGNTTGGTDIVVETGDMVTIVDAPSAGIDATNKTYVDAQVGANNELSEILANGNTTGGSDIVVQTGDKITITDAPGVDTAGANKLYVDTVAAAQNELSEVLANGNTSGVNDIIVDASQVITITDQPTADTDGANKKYVDTIVNAAIRLQGDWNADTNTPDISGTTTTGFAWRVSVAGATDLGGITLWEVGDLAVKTDGGWLRIANADISAIWGNISGTLSNQTDLQSALDLKGTAVDVALNTTHRGSAGTDHSDVGLNNTHRTSDGSDHSFLDQSVVSGASPLFATQTPGDNSTKAATTAYVEDAVLAEDFWDRAGTVISPKTDGDNVATTGIFDSQGYKFSFDTPIENFNTFTARASFPITTQWHDMAYSPSLNRLVVVGWGEIVYSDDQGESWTDEETLIEGILRGVAWSPTLNLFATTNTTDIWTSPDGINWTVRETGSGLGTSMDWFPHLGLFVTPSYWSADGISWTASTVAATSYTGSVYMPSFGKIVGIAESAPHAVYETADGKTWSNIGTVTPIADGLMRGAISYSETLNRLIVGVAFSNTDNAYSDDGGVNWTTTGESSGFHTYAIEWSPDHNLFFTSTNSGTKSSPDGLTWTSLISDITGDKEPSLYERTLNRWFIGSSTTAGFWATDEMHPLFDGDILQRDSSGDVKANPLVRLSDAGVFTGLVQINDGVIATTQSPLNNSTKLATTKYVDDAVEVENLWDLIGTDLKPHDLGVDLIIDGLIQADGFFGELTGTIATTTTGVTQTPGDNSTLMATNEYVDAAVLVSAGVDVFDIFSESDFPTPAAGISTLPSGKYILKDAVTLSAIDEFQCVASAVIEWTNEDKENHTLTHVANSKTLFNLSGGSRFKIEHASFVLSGNSSQFISMTGSNFSSKINDFRVTFSGTGSTIGAVTDIFPGTIEFIDGTIAGFTNGITVENAGGVQILGAFFVSNTTGTGAVINALNIPAIAAFLSRNVFIIGSSESVFFIDPTIEVTIQVQNNITNRLGEFFQSGATGTFTEVADASVGATVINDVTPSSGLARFEWIAGPTVYAGQEVVISAFVAAENLHYNGTHIIKNVGVGWFEVQNIPYGSDEAGSFLSNSVTLTDTSTTLADGDKISLDTTLSTDYDSGTFVYNKQTNTVQVNKTWAATESGTWNAGSLTEADKWVLAEVNEGEGDSINFAYTHIEKNSVATTISTADTYQDMNLTGSTGAITVFATNGAGGTTVTSATHGLVENQNVEIEGTTSYNGLFRVFNVTTNTYDIPVTFVADDATGTWFSRILEAEATKRFKVIDLVTNKIEYTGNEDFIGLVTYIIAVVKTATSQDYLFSLAKNDVIPTHVPFGERSVTTSLGSLSVSIPVELVTGDTVKPQLAGVGTTSNMTVQNLITSIQ